MFTVKAFKPFELIEEEKETLSEAEKRFNELVETPEIDAAYVFQDGVLVRSWDDDYDHPNGGYEYPLSYTSEWRGSYHRMKDSGLFDVKVWKKREGEEWKGDYIPWDGVGGPLEMGSFHITAHDESGNFADFLLDIHTTYEALRVILGFYYKIYHVARLTQAALHAIHTDALFSEEIMGEIDYQLKDLIGRESIPAEKDGDNAQPA